MFPFQGHIDLFKQGSELIYRLKGTSRARGGDAEEKIVYGIIEEAGNKVGAGLAFKIVAGVVVVIVSTPQQW